MTDWLWRWATRALDAVSCFFEHVPEGPLGYDDMPISLAIAVRDIQLRNMLEVALLYPVFRCRRCHSLLIRTGSNGRWASVSLDFVAALVARTRMIRMTASVTDQLTTHRFN